MDIKDRIERILDEISPQARAWSDNRYMSALITAAAELEGQDLHEYIRILVQLSYDEGAAAK